MRTSHSVAAVRASFSRTRFSANDFSAERWRAQSLTPFLSSETSSTQNLVKTHKSFSETLRGQNFFQCQRSSRRSATFASNVGADVATVFSGSLTLSSTNAAGPGNTHVFDVVAK